ncbi:hypothetical protein BDV95DRAFT_210139 [Massariosphaeria phaeospora]|uniref:Nephrocystin 3-like N-terminal domain-containing protein n=1 Tax=Massariosphaeria phaeospora TaxID=100035 RepID=A0A7C8MGB8_9PLEO|nr:hypothetical protein BDV95DRAFT_210139 [Massariosphaeria phaeospora]
MNAFNLHNLDQLSVQLEENLANILATILEMIGYSTKAIQRKRWRELWAKVFGKDDERLETLRETLKEYVRQSSRIMEMEIKNMVIANEQQMKGIGADVKSLGSNLKDLGQDLSAKWDQIHKQQDGDRLSRLHEILNPTSTYEDQLDDIQRARVAGTGDWLLAEPVFESWLNQNDALLWICGSPGSGKTFVAGSIVTMLHASQFSNQPQWQDTSVSFYFFGERNRIGGFHQALRDMAW